MMLIAHRGASLLKQDNSIEGLRLASDLGADAIECDVQQTKDGVYVLFHDTNLSAFTHDDRAVTDIMYEEMKESLAGVGYHLDTLEELLRSYHGNAAILLDINLKEPTEDFFRYVKDSGHHFVCGLTNPDFIGVCRKVFPPEQILSFIFPYDRMNFRAYYEAGAGIIRLWEDWLPELTPEIIKSACPGARVFIMSNDPVTGMNGNAMSLQRLHALGADGVLLNDIKLAVAEKAHAFNGGCMK